MAELPEIVSRAVERFGDATAIRCSDGEMSFRALEARVSQAAQAMRARGLQPGHRICTVLPPGPEHIAILLAGIRAGVVVCPLSDRLPPDGVSDRRAAIGAGLLVSESAQAAIAPYALFTGEPAPFEALRIGSSQRAVLLYTSGSTGEPKAAALNYGNLFYNAVYANHNIDAGAGSTWLLSLPLYHVGGLGIVFRCLLDGGAIAIPDSGEALEDAIARYNVTHISVVSTQLRRLIDTGADLSKLRCVLLGGGPAPEDLVKRSIAHGVPLYTTYGMTEMASQITTTAPRDSADRLYTSGKPLLKDTIRVSSAGEIEVTGETLFEGYWLNGITERPLTQDGWFRTGDLGHFDALGYLHVTGRRDNMFISGGENIQPEEIEAALLNIQGIQQAIVVPIDHPEWGKRPVAFIEWNGTPKTTTELRDALAKTHPKFKIPEAFHEWPRDLPEGMKASRSDLTRLAASIPDRHI